MMRFLLIFFGIVYSLNLYGHEEGLSKNLDTALRTTVAYSALQNSEDGNVEFGPIVFQPAFSKKHTDQKSINETSLKVAYQKCVCCCYYLCYPCLASNSKS
jgi:hypothetical protein